MYVLQFESLE